MTIDAIDNPCGGPAGTGVNAGWPGADVAAYPGIGVPLGDEYGLFDAAGAAFEATGGTFDVDVGRAVGALEAPAALVAGALLACAAALFGAVGCTAAGCAAAVFDAAVFAAAGFDAVDFATGDCAEFAVAGLAFAADAAGFLADGVAFALGALDAARVAGVGVDGVVPSELLVAIRTL